MRVRLTKELVIEFDDLRVVVGLAHSLALILGVKGFRSLLFVGIDDIVIFPLARTPSTILVPASCQ